MRDMERPIDSISPAAGPQRRHTAPIAVLLIASPVIAEVLFGTTRVTTLFVLIPQIGAWGCGSLIIRDLARRRGRGGGAILLLGLAIAVAEECLIQQTSLAPLVGVDPRRIYGRMFGVNWVYFLWALGYESIWAVVLPIQLTELVFPACRREPWLGARGLAAVAAVFVLASILAWYLWTQVFVPRFFPESAYRVPWTAIVMAGAAILMLSAAALGPRPTSRAEGGIVRPAPPPWRVVLVGFALGLPWFALVFLAYGALPALPAAIPILLGIALAGLAFSVITRWSSRCAWQDVHSLALISGALLANMLAGFAVMNVSGVSVVDIVGKTVFNLAALLLLIHIGRILQRRGEPA
jgi:hypothetical protein